MARELEWAVIEIPQDSLGIQEMLRQGPSLEDVCRMFAVPAEAFGPDAEEYAEAKRRGDPRYDTHYWHPEHGWAPKREAAPDGE